MTRVGRCSIGHRSTRRGSGGWCPATGCRGGSPSSPSSGSRSRCRTGATCSSMRASISRRPGSGWRAAIPGTSRSRATTSRRHRRRCSPSRRSPSCPPTPRSRSSPLAVIAGGVATIRLLHLPWWWLLFPPLVQCVLSGNVQSLIVPLILLPAGGLAVILKIYAGLPLAILGRWRCAGRGGRDHARDRPVPAVGDLHQRVRAHLPAAGGPVQAHAADGLPRSSSRRSSC